MSLSFLSASLLVGLAAVAAPVLIHLISRRRARRVRFAAIEFVLRSQRRSARSIRLRQFLLLLLRCLFVAAIALAIAQPVLSEDDVTAADQPPVAVALVVDASASMQAVIDGKSAFARAIDQARQTVDELPADTPVCVTRCGLPLSDALAPATFDHRAVRASLDAMQPGFSRSDLGACAAHAASLLMSTPGEGERKIIVLSDLASHALPAAAGSVDEGIVVAWQQVMPGDENIPNHAITSVAVKPGAGGDGIVIIVTEV